MISQSLADDRVQALKVRAATYGIHCIIMCTQLQYCRRLVLGRVVEHVKKEEHMYDSKRLQYRFADVAHIERRLEQRQQNPQ